MPPSVAYARSDHAYRHADQVTHRYRQHAAARLLWERAEGALAYLHLVLLQAKLDELGGHRKAGDPMAERGSGRFAW